MRLIILGWMPHASNTVTWSHGLLSKAVASLLSPEAAPARKAWMVMNTTSLSAGGGVVGAGTGRWALATREVYTQRTTYVHRALNGNSPSLPWPWLLEWSVSTPCSSSSSS